MKSSDKIDALAWSDGRMEALFRALDALTEVDTTEPEAFEASQAWIEVQRVNENGKVIELRPDGIHVRPLNGPIADNVRAIANEMGIGWREADQVYLTSGEPSRQFMTRAAAALGGGVNYVAAD